MQEHCQITGSQNNLHVGILSGTLVPSDSPKTWTMLSKGIVFYRILIPG